MERDAQSELRNSYLITVWQHRYNSRSLKQLHAEFKSPRALQGRLESSEKLIESKQTLQSIISIYF